MSVHAKLNWYGDKITKEVREAAADGLLQAAEHILEEANRTVPHDEGTLMRSGESSVDLAKLQAAVSYDTPYAVRLHEHPEYHFQQGRRGKWLEMTLKERGETARDIIKNAVKAALGG